MRHGHGWRCLISALMLGFAEITVIVAASLVLPSAAQAQLFDERFPTWGRRQGGQQRDFFSPFGPFQQQEPPRQDFSKAPPPAKTDTTTPTTPALTSVVVMGDSMSDWLAYGLEQAFADSPDIGILRKHRTVSGLIHNDTKVDPKGLYPDWPQLPRDIVNADKA